MKKQLALFTILILLLCGYLFYSKSNKVSPVFSALHASSGSSDRLADTSASVYESLLDVYLFKDSTGQLQEINLSGNADLKTGMSIYSQAIKTLLLKSKSTQNFVLAGAAKIAMDLPFSEEAQTLKDTTASKNIKQQLLALRNNQQTVQQTQANEDAFQFFLKEHKKILLKNGLIRQHELPVAIIPEVREKIAKAISQRATTLDFEDILKKHDIPKAALFINTFRLDNGEALVIRIPTSTIYNKNFKTIQEENRKLLQIMSIEGLRKKIDFHNQQIGKLNQELRLYESLSAEGLKEFIYSNQCLSAEGLLYDCQGSKISRAEYINFRIPYFIKGITNKVRDLDLTLTKLKNEQAANSTIENINEESLIDAMLRDIDSPWAYNQELFTKWKKSQRDRIWMEINKALKKINVSSNALGGAATFFTIRRQEDFLEIRPQQFLDLSKSVLLLDPGQNITQVVAKEKRIASNFNNKQHHSKNNATSFIASQLVKTAEEGNLAKLKKQILRHLKNTPTETTEVLINLLNPSSTQQKKSEALLFEKATSVLQASNFLASIEHLSTAPKYKNDFSLYLVQLKNILEEHPNAPVDFHLNYAIRLAEVLSKIQNIQKPDQPLSVWEILKTCSKNEQAFDLENKIIKENYLSLPFNLPEEIRSTMAYIKKNDPAYYALADKTQGFPETNSEKYKSFIGTQSVKSVFQKQANQYLAKRNRLQEYLNKKNTAANGRPPYPLIDFENQKTLLQLRHFDHSSSIITDSKVLQSRILFESGEYIPAINLLFDSLNPLIFYHPDLQWKNLNPIPFPPQKIEAVINDKELNIYTEQNDQRNLALKIFNLPPGDLISLCKKINKLPKSTWQKKGDFTYMLLSTKIKINDHLFQLHQAIKDPEIKTAILKTMIFTPLLPGDQFL